MILISAGLVLTAIALLIAGFVMAKPFLVMWSIAVSVLSAVFLVIGALLRRHELFPGGGRAGVVPPLPPMAPVPPGPLSGLPAMSSQLASPVPHTTVPHGAQRAAATQPRLSRPVAGPVPAAGRGVLDDEAIVLVIPGRKRFHVTGCRQLADREHEELTHEEAREEGFTACTTCLPEFTAGIPQGVSVPAQQPAKAAKPAPSQGSGQGSGISGLGDTGESGAHQTAARFASPTVSSAASPGAQEAPATRPDAHRPATASGEQVRSGQREQPRQDRDRPRQEHERSGPEREQTPPRKAPAPPLRAAEPVIPSLPIRPSISIPEASSEPNATSWFSREAAKSPESKAGQEAKPSARAGGPAEPGSVGSGPEPESTTGSRSPATGPKAASVSSSEAGKATASASARTTSGAAPAEPAKTAEPVGPVGAGSGRAGRPAPADPASAASVPKAPAAGGKTRKGTSPAVPDDDREDADTAPRGIPVVRADIAAPETVKIIVGTRRFHGSTCPLIKGVDAAGLESMTLAEAEKAGMSSCSVCRATT